jgi:hypothetical protein
LSIKHNNSEKQLYRINLFNTTSVIDINGKVYQQFITNDLPRITTSVDLREVKELNKKIRKVCELVIDIHRECTTLNAYDHVVYVY